MLFDLTRMWNTKKQRLLYVVVIFSLNQIFHYGIFFSFCISMTPDHKENTFTSITLFSFIRIFCHAFECMAVSFKSRLIIMAVKKNNVPLLIPKYIVKNADLLYLLVTVIF